MAVLNFTGFETGDTSELAAVGAAASVQSTTKKNGTYALRLNPSAGTTSWARIQGVGSTGKAAGFGRTAATYYGFWFRYASATGSPQTVASVRDAADAEVFTLFLSGNQIDLSLGGTPVGGGFTLSANTWYFIELEATSNGLVKLRHDGSGFSSLTPCANLTQDRLVLGSSASSTFDFYYDDVYIDDAAWLGGAQVLVAVPTGDSATNTAWSASTGNKWACVDELPPSATDYIEALTTAGDRRYSATHASATTLGVFGGIRGVKSMAIFWEPTSTTTLGVIGIRSGATNFELTAVDIGTTAEVTMARVDATDPNTSASWTRANFDAAEPLVRRSTSDTSNIRVKWMGLMVLSTGPVTLAGAQPAPSGSLAKKFLKSLAGAEPAPSGALADITIIPGGVDLAGAQPAPSGSLAHVYTQFKSLAGAQPAPSGAIAFKRTLSHFTLAGAQPAPSGALAALHSLFVALAGAQPAPSGSIAADLILRHFTLAGAQPAPSGTIAAVRAKFIALAGAQPAPSGALIIEWVNKFLQGNQPNATGALAFDRLLTHIALAGAQPAPSGAIAAVSATFVDLAGNQPAALGALVPLFVNKLLEGNQPNATGLLTALHTALVTLSGDQPFATGSVVGVAPIRDYTPSPGAQSARLVILQPQAGSIRAGDNPKAGSAREQRPTRGSARLTP